MNMLEATLEQRNGALVAKAGSQQIELGAETLDQRPGLKSYAGREVILGIRPEDLEDATLASDTHAELHGTVALREALGSEIMVHFAVDASPALTEDVRELAEDAGDDRIPQEAAHEGRTTMVGRFGARSKVRPGDEIRVAVDTRSLHFFDAKTSLGIYDETTTEGAA